MLMQFKLTFADFDRFYKLEIRGDGILKNLLL
jgi:hypothetical protein